MKLRYKPFMPILSILLGIYSLINIAHKYDVTDKNVNYMYYRADFLTTILTYFRVMYHSGKFVYDRSEKQWRDPKFRLYTVLSALYVIINMLVYDKVMPMFGLLFYFAVSNGIVLHLTNISLNFLIFILYFFYGINGL